MAVWIWDVGVVLGAQVDHWAAVRNNASRDEPVRIVVALLWALEAIALAVRILPRARRVTTDLEDWLK